MYYHTNTLCSAFNSVNIDDSFKIFEDCDFGIVL